MSNIDELFKMYEDLRILESKLDTQIAEYQKDSKNSQINEIEYQEIYHALSCITDAEQAFFGGLSCLNERKLKEDEYWLDFMERPEMHKTTPKKGDTNQ